MLVYAGFSCFIGREPLSRDPILYNDIPSVNAGADDCDRGRGDAVAPCVPLLRAIQSE